MGMEDIVGKYIKQLHEPNHRFKSWEHCFMAFRILIMMLII